MTAIPVGFAEATFVFQCTGRPRQCTWAMGLDISEDPDADPSTIATTVYDAYVGTNDPIAAAHMCAGWSFIGVSVSKMLETGPIVGQSFLTVVGTATNGSVPVNTSVLANKQTALGGRRNRGRAYIPPVWPPEEFVDQAGVMDATRQGQLQGWYDSFFSTLSTSDYTPTLFHQTAPFTPTPITGFVIGTQLATQRRRMRS